MANCRNCGKEIEQGVGIGRFCSHKCYELWQKFNRKPNCTCPICGKEFFVKLSRLNKLKHQPTCSVECAAVLRSIYFTGEQNHQYGIKGEDNASFKGETTISNYGYILEYCPDHPFTRNGNNGRVLQHRLVVEENAEKFDDKYFITINSKKYLRPEYIVHHINENKQDNRIENLTIMTLGEHQSHHNLKNTIIRNELGQIIGITKSGKNGEPCDGNTVLTESIAKGLSAV